jgi:hypothetical protein
VKHRQARRILGFGTSPLKLSAEINCPMRFSRKRISVVGFQGDVIAHRPAVDDPFDRATIPGNAWGSTETARYASAMAGVPARLSGKVPSPGASPSMGSKRDRQDVLRMRASAGFHPASPGRDASDPLLDRAASRVPANPVDVRRDEPVAASLGRSTVQRRRRFCVVPFWNLTQSSGRRARPPSSGRSTRQRRNVKRSRRAPGATRRVLGRSPTSARHPEHGEAG